MDDLVQECYSKHYEGLPYWMTITLDYDALKQDYTPIEIDGVTYLYR